MLHVYCVTYKNPERRDRMQRRFDTLGLSHTFIESIDAFDPRIIPPLDYRNTALAGRWNPKGYSALWGHLMAFEQMLADGHKMAIVCEDDIMMRTDYQQHLPDMIQSFQRRQLDILLLGYLTTDAPMDANWTFDKQGEIFGYFSYPQWHWGVQQYIIADHYAAHLLKYFGLSYAHQSLIDPALTAYSTDWILSKMTEKRAMISPQMAVEECPPDIHANSDTIYHYNCHVSNYVPGLHI